MPILANQLRLTETALVYPSVVGSDEDGAEVRFLGRVRATEDGRSILGIEYVCYDAMAERALVSIVEEAEREFGPHQRIIAHRTGFVPAGETSILIVVSTAHSGMAFDVCRHYLGRIKAEVPIWKHPVFA